MERGVDHARGHPIGNLRARLARAAGEPPAVAVADSALLRVLRMNFEQVFLVPERVGGAACLRADIVLRQDTARSKEQREARLVFPLVAVYPMNLPAPRTKRS